MVEGPSQKAFPVSWDQFHRDARALAWRLDGKGPGEGGAWKAVVGITRGYPNMMQATVIMSRDTLRMVGQADTGPRVGPLMVKVSDPAQGVLTLRGESEETRATGFFRTALDATGAPQRLLWGDCNYAYAGRALDADVLIITASRFDQFPDIQTTSESYHQSL